jgi:hypothetical protein
MQNHERHSIDELSGGMHLTNEEMQSLQFIRGRGYEPDYYTDTNPDAYRPAIVPDNRDAWAGPASDAARSKPIDSRE